MQESIVHIKEGKLRGKVCTDYDGEKYYSFQGIPYAKPPFGNLRFKSPVPAEPWKGIKDATKEGNVSVQIDGATQKIIGSEDCLFLNVYTRQVKPTSDDKLKPIFVMVHGGRFIDGSGNSDFLGPDYFLTEDIIVVTVNYRLGYLGFLSLDDPSLHVPGNAALKDVVMALKWIQNNIKSFCGDRNKVTVGGASAGADMVHLLMLSPMTKGLFHRIIMQSGSAFHPWSLAKSNPKLIAKELGYDGNDEKEILKLLQSISPDSLLTVQNKLYDYFYCDKMRSMGPVIENQLNEGTFLSEHPADIIKSGKYNKVPFIIGYNSKEGIICKVLYGDQPPDFENFDDFKKVIPYYFNIPNDKEFVEYIAEKIRKYYYKDNGIVKSNTEKFITMQTDVLVILGLYNTINLTLDNSEHPIYFYRLSADTKLNFMKKIIDLKVPGTCHGDEIGYLFKTNLTVPFTEGSKEEMCMRNMVKLWANFIKTGNPNNKVNTGLNNVTWEPVKMGKYNYLDIDKKLTAAINLDVERMEIWNEISTINRYESKF